MSLIINADGEYLSGSGTVFGASGLTEATFAIWVKRDSASSTYQSYCYIGRDVALPYGSMWLAHNGTASDCFVVPSGSERRTVGSGDANSTSWQLLVQTYKKDVATKVYAAITGGSVVATTGVTDANAFNADLDNIRIGLGAPLADGWYPRARMAHCAFWNKELTAAQVNELFNGGTAGAGKNPQSVQNANLTFYAPLTSDATVTIGGVSLSATGTLTYDGADNPNVEAYGSTQNVTVANVTQANSVSGAAVYQATANGTLTTPPLKNNSRTLMANISGWTVDVKNATTNTLVVRVTGLTTSALGVLTVTDPLIVTGTDYAFEPSHATYGRILPVLTAT